MGYWTEDLGQLGGRGGWCNVVDRRLGAVLGGESGGDFEGRCCWLVA